MQHDFDITKVDANTGATMRTQINAALQALATNSALTTEPGTKYPFMWWADSTADTLKQRNAGNTAWVNVLALSTGVAVKSEIVSTNALAQVYPVGSIYLSVVATNPATLFGFGTWVALYDRMLIGAGSGYGNGGTGGEVNHTLTIGEMPSHTHTFGITNGNAGSAGGYAGQPVTFNPETSATGGNAAHNNMPPYLAVHMWKRTA